MSIRSTILATLAAGLVAAPALGDVNLEFRAIDVCSVGDTLDVELYAVSSAPEGQSFAALELVLVWDASKLRLIGLDNSGAVARLSSSFPTVLDGNLNEVVPPQDGDGMYRYMGPLGDPQMSTPSGALVTTLKFEALAAATATTINIEASGGNPTVVTVVYDGEIAGMPVTGTLDGATVEIDCPTGDCDEPCDGDIDGDGTIAFGDLLAVLSDWGPCSGCASDIDGDGMVAFNDLLAILSGWGPCP